MQTFLIQFLEILVKLNVIRNPSYERLRMHSFVQQTSKSKGYGKYGKPSNYGPCISQGNITIPKKKAYLF